MKRTRTAVLTIALALGLALTVAAPAIAAPEDAHMAEVQDTVLADQAQLNVEAVQQAQAADQDGNDAQLGDQPGDINNGPFPDGGSDEVVPDDDNDGPFPDGGDEEVVPPDEQSSNPPTVTVPPPSGTPSSTPEPTPTPRPNTPSHRGELAYTGGNATIYLVLGTLIALAGTALLVRTVLAGGKK